MKVQNKKITTDSNYLNTKQAIMPYSSPRSPIQEKQTIYTKSSSCSNSRDIKYCNKCVMNSTIPNVVFDKNGLCNYCHIHINLEKEYPLDGSLGPKIKYLMRKIKKDGKNKEYDCAVGISGGCDSSYLLYLLKEKYDLRPLAITFDNTWSSTIAVENILNMTEALDVDLHTSVVDGNEFNDICRSFLYASTPDADVATDIAIAKLFYMAMEEFDIKYSFCGHSFRSEGTVPLGWTYMDGMYINSVHKKFGTIPFKTFPNLEVEYWIKQLQRQDSIDRIRLLYYENYDKEEVKKLLYKKFGWQWYGGHHHENEWTKFVKSYLLPNKFNIDKRYVEYSALIRSGQMQRYRAIRLLEEKPKVEKHFVDYVLKRLNLTEVEFKRIMSLEIKSHHDYKTYKSFFKKNKKQFARFLDKGLISRTFFEKYVIQY